MQSGKQRGTSRREDVLDTVINFEKPKDYTIDKDGQQYWVTNSIEASTYDKVVELYKDGYKQKEISDELDIHKSVVSRHISKARELGDIAEE